MPKALFNNINLTTWINMPKSLSLNCRGRFFQPDKIHISTSRNPGNYSCCGFIIIYSTLTKYLLHNSKAGRNRSFRQKALFNNINLTTWINMSKSLALNCRGRFFHSDKIHTSTILEPGNIYYSCWQSAASHLVNKILHPEKVPTSQVESRPPS